MEKQIIELDQSHELLNEIVPISSETAFSV